MLRRHDSASRFQPGIERSSELQELPRNARNKDGVRERDSILDFPGRA